MRVTLVEEIEELRPYRSAWRTLLVATPQATFFQSLEWLEVYWKHFGKDKRLRVFLVYDGDELAGIVPLMVTTEPTKVGKVRFLTYPLDYWGSFYGPIGPKADAVLQAVLEALPAFPDDWDVLELRWVDGSRPEAEQFRLVMERCGFSPLVTILDHTAIIRLEGTWDDYWKSRTSKWRNNYRRWTRRLSELGTVEHVRYRPQGAAVGDGDPQWSLFEACQQVARASWQSRSRDGTTICHEAIRPFIRDAHAAAASLGALDVNLLLLDGRPAAFAYNYRFQKSLYGLRVGYDPEFARGGVGNVLYAKIIESSFALGDELYDLGPGSLECKRYFHTEVRPILRYSHIPCRSLRAALLRAKRTIDARSTRKEILGQSRNAGR